MIKKLKADMDEIAGEVNRLQNTFELIRRTVSAIISCYPKDVPEDLRKIKQDAEYGIGRCRFIKGDTNPL